jgi:hypothetical protein
LSVPTDIYVLILVFMLLFIFLFLKRCRRPVPFNVLVYLFSQIDYYISFGSGLAEYGPESR